MADNFGLKIGIEGEQEFKAALRDINASFKVLGSEMKLVESEFDKQDKSIEAVSARNQVLSKEIQAQSEKISVLEKALANASSSFGENDRRTQAWAVQLNNAKAELNNLERELEKNNKSLNETGDEFEKADKEAEKFEREIKKSADSADDAGGKFAKLGGVLKGVGASMGAAAAAIGTAAVGAAKQLSDMAVGASSYADNILTMSTVTGMSAEKLQAYDYAAELVDTSLETLTSSMAKNIRSMTAAEKGTGAVADAYKALGVSVTDSHGKLRDSETVYWETIDALGRISDETERDALSMQIFGKSAQELNPLIAQGSAGIAKLTEEAKNMGAVMSDDQLSSLGKFDDTIQRLKSGSEAAKNALGMVLLPQLQALGTDGVTLLGNFTKGLNDAGGDFSKISEVIGSTVGGIANMILSNMPQIIDVALNIVMSIIKAITDNLPQLIDTASKMVFTLLQGLIKALPQITDGALQLILALVNGIIANLPALTSAALNMIVTLASGIGDALPQLIPAIVDAVILIVQTLLDNMDKILDAAFKIIMGLAKGLINALPKLIDALPKIIDAIIDFITNNLPLIVEMGIKLVVELAIGLVKAIPRLVAAIPQIIAALLGGFGKAVGYIGKIGVNIVKGLWNGIVSMTTWIKDKISDFIGGIVSGVKGLLGIRSPSTVFAGIGSNMGEGIGVGFEKAMNGVKDNMQKAIPTSFDTNVTLKTKQNNGAYNNDTQLNPLMLTITNFYNNRTQDIEQLAYELEFYRQRVASATGGV